MPFGSIYSVKLNIWYKLKIFQKILQMSSLRMGILEHFVEFVFENRHKQQQFAEFIFANGSQINKKPMYLR